MPVTFTAKSKGKQLTGNFARDMAKFKDKVVSQIENAIKEAVGRMYDEIIDRSPVDTGLYKANQQLSLNSSDDSFFYRERPRKGDSYSAAPTIMLAKHKLSGYKLGDKVFIYNNLPYSIFLEFGHSSKAPMGIYRVSALNFKGYLLEAINRTKQ